MVNRSVEGSLMNIIEEVNTSKAGNRIVNAFKVAYVLSILFSSFLILSAKSDFITDSMFFCLVPFSLSVVLLIKSKQKCVIQADKTTIVLSALLSILFCIMINFWGMEDFYTSSLSFLGTGPILFNFFYFALAFILPIQVFLSVFIVVNKILVTVVSPPPPKNLVEFNL